MPPAINSVHKGADLSLDGPLHLPPDVCHSICSAHTDLYDVLQTRLSFNYMREPAALLVKILIARNAHLPALAWTIYPLAKGLVIRSSAADNLESQLEHLAQSLPTRVQYIYVHRASPSSSHAYSTFIRRLGASACASTLKRFDCHVNITPAAADHAIRTFPNIEHLLLSVMHPRDVPTPPTNTTLSSFPTTLKTLYLATRDATLDISALAACTNLEHLHLLAPRNNLRNIASLASCTALRHLHLSDNALHPTASQQVVQHIRQLQQLRSLRLPCLTISTSTQQWQQLAAMASLEELELNNLVIDAAAAPPASRVKTITMQDARSTQPDAPLPHGCFTALLPRAEHIAIKYSKHSARSWGRALHAHPNLTAVHVSDSAQQEEGGHLATIPQLQKVVLEHMPASVVQALHEVAACSRLQEFKLAVAPGDLDMPALVAAFRGLAAGACRNTLCKVLLDTYAAAHFPFGDTGHGMSALDVAALLQSMCAQMPQLEEVSLDVVLEAEGVLAGDVEAAWRALAGRKDTSDQQQQEQQQEEQGVSGVVRDAGGSRQWLAQQLVVQLEQRGVVLEDVRVLEPWGAEEGGRKRRDELSARVPFGVCVEVVGRLGRCRVVLCVWP